MATTKISALAALTTTDGAEELLINDGGTSKKVTIDNVLHDNSIRAEHYVDGSIATAHIADDAVTEDKLANAINTAIAANTAKTSNATHTGDVTGATTLTIADDAVTAAKLANSINTEIAANTAKVTNATHTGDVTGATALTIGNDKVVTAMILDDNVTADKLANSINTAIAANTAKVTNATHSGEVTGATALTIADNVVDEANLKVSNSPTNGSAASWAVLDTDANTTTKGLYEHAHTISANYSITSGNNAFTAGAITINSGVSVTIPTGSTWVIA